MELQDVVALCFSFICYQWLHGPNRHSNAVVLLKTVTVCNEYDFKARANTPILYGGQGFLSRDHIGLRRVVNRFLCFASQRWRFETFLERQTVHDCLAYLFAYFFLLLYINKKSTAQQQSRSSNRYTSPKSCQEQSRLIFQLTTSSWTS